MPTLTQLNSDAHADLKVVPNAAIDVARQQHVMNVRAAEIGYAAGCFPLFFAANPTTGQLALTALTALEEGQNLYVQGEQWAATYLPAAMRSFPLFLMQADNDKGYDVGIDETSPVFSRDSGEALFDDNGNPSIYHSELRRMLEESVEQERQTAMFNRRVVDLGLLRPLDIVCVHESGDAKTITGLQSVDEDILNGLDDSIVLELHKNGYLLTLTAMLLSTQQLNRLLQLHNATNPERALRQVKLQVARDPGLGGETPA